MVLTSLIASLVDFSVEVGPVGSASYGSSQTRRKTPCPRLSMVLARLVLDVEVVLLQAKGPSSQSRGEAALSRV